MVKQPAGEGLEALRWRARRLAERHIVESDEVRFSLRGLNGQVLVALQDRLLIIKPGISAGATGGGRVTTFYYRDITNLEANTGFVGGVLEVNTPAYPGTHTKDYWSQSKDRNPRVASNCIPIDRQGLSAFTPYLDQLRRWISEAKTPTQGASSAPSLSDELQKLAALKESGVLTDEEFQQAKQRLISG